MAGLEEILSKAREFLDLSPLATYISNFEGQIIDCNNLFLELFGYTTDELGCMNIGDLYPSDQEDVGEKRESFIQELISNETVADHEEILLTKSGSELVSKVTAKKIGTFERQTYYLGFVRDVTQRRQLMDRLIHSSRQASVGNLAAGLAHDFNNILTAVRGNAELLMEMDIPPAVTAKLDIIINATGRAQDLARKLLAYSRQGKYNPKDIDVGDIVKESVALLEKGLLSTHSYSLETDLKSLMLVNADATQLNQVVQNLVINARDAMPSGGIIKITTEDIKTISNTIGIGYSYNGLKSPIAFIPPGWYLKLSIFDNGTGIDEETLTRIYEPYFTTKKEGKGTGLGLAMTYGIVKNHSGYIDVITITEGSKHGTRFDIYLPSKPRITSVWGGDETTGEILVTRGKGKVMVVDDETIITELISEYLDGKGYKVVTTNNPLEAIEMYTQERPDVVLTDLIMPQMNGQELFHQIRAINPSAKVYMMSGYSKEELVQEMIGQGAQGFIEKPFRKLSELSELVDSCIKMH